MALKNVIYTGTYTTVSVNYNKKQRFFQINATVFEDATCKNVITTISSIHQAINETKEISSSEKPQVPKEGDVFFSPIKINVDDAEQFGVFTYNGTAWNCKHVNSVFCNDTYYKYGDEKYIVDTNPDNSKWWDSQFSLEQIKSKTDILAFAYTWLKENHSAFKNAEDC